MTAERATGYEERRRFPRAVFKTEEAVSAILTLSGNLLEKRTVQILNISRGGLGLAIKKDHIDGIKMNSLLFLTEMRIGEKDSILLPSMDLRVAWVVAHDFLDNVGFGCEFMNPNKRNVENIVNFVNACFPNRIS